MSSLVSKQCPSCHTVGSWRRSRARGFLERRMLSLFGYTPVRCAACRQRVKVFGGRLPKPSHTPREDRRRAGRSANTSDPGASPRDDEDFRLLIAQLRRSEARLEANEPR